MYLSTKEAMKLFGYKNHNSILHLVKTKRLQEYTLAVTGKKYFLKSECLELLGKIKGGIDGRTY